MTENEMLKAVYDRMLEVYGSIGLLTAELAEHRAEDREAIAAVRADIRTLRGTDREIRKKVDSVADDVEATGKHIIYGRRKWDATWRWVVRTVIVAMAAAATSVVTWYLSTKGQ
jgi:hypothetical protein